MSFKITNPINGIQPMSEPVGMKFYQKDMAQKKVKEQINKEKADLIAKALSSPEEKQKMIEAMIEPIKQHLDYQGIGKKLLMVDELPQGAYAKHNNGNWSVGMMEESVEQLKWALQMETKDKSTEEKRAELINMALQTDEGKEALSRAMGHTYQNMLKEIFKREGIDAQEVVKIKASVKKTLKKFLNGKDFDKGNIIEEF